MDLSVGRRRLFPGKRREGEGLGDRRAYFTFSLVFIDSQISKSSIP